MYCVYALYGIYCFIMDFHIQSSGQLSSHLRALRKARGMSQQQLGEMLGVGQTRVARIERDPASISVDQFLQILNALDAHMVLQQGVVRSAAGTAAGKSTAKAIGRKRQPDEPW